MKFKLIFYLSLTLLTTNCATKDKSSALGAGIGLTAGSYIGALIQSGSRPSSKRSNIILGGSLGAMVGSLSGSAIHAYGLSKAKKKEFTHLKNNKANTIYYKTLPSKLGNQYQIKSIFVQETFKNENFIPAHFEHSSTRRYSW